jgi:eukaryotic-like serine/threonine-protein kinase
MSSTVEQLNGALAGRYRIERELGRGGMATVYLAADIRHDRKVALKLLSADLVHAIGADRFLREIRLTAQLEHPHILPILDSGEADGVLFYTMPFVDGESLRERIDREGPLPLDDALRIATEVADALEHAHRAGVVHRDVKPENVLIGSGHARVADFGVARPAAGRGFETLTATGISLGTPAYMSPEQAAGDGAVDGRSDIYSLGCVLYEMLTGHPPFSGRSMQELLARHSLDPVPSIAAARAVPPHLERAITRALAKAPADRFATAAAFAQALRPGDVERAGGPSGRRRLVAAGVALAVLLVAAGAYVVLNGGQETRAMTDGRRAIAVLPFQFLGGDQAQSYIAGGLHDELLTQLSRVGQLRVISRTSVMGYAAGNTPVRQIGRELNVGTVLEGTVQVLGERLRVNVQLIDASTDEHLWAERFDRTLDDAFQIQSEIAQRVTDAVGAALDGTERQTLSRMPTWDAEAYRLYLQALQYVRRPGYQRPDIEAAQQLLERAVSRDSSFAEARALLVRTHVTIYDSRLDASPERLAAIRREAAIAVRLAPTAPEVRLAVAEVHMIEGNVRAYIEETRAALESMSAGSEASGRLAGVLVTEGKFSQAVEVLEKAAPSDPRNAMLFYAMGVSNTWLGRYEAGTAALDRALTLAPDFHIAAVVRGWAYAIWQGQLDTIRAVLARTPPTAPLDVYGTIDAHRLQLELWSRNPDALLAVARSVGQPVVQGQPFYWPVSLYAAWAHRLKGDSLAARAAFDSARSLASSALLREPGDWRIRAAHGLALGGLGRHGEALAESQALAASPSYTDDGLWRPLVSEMRMRIMAQSGAHDDALREMERLFRGDLGEGRGFFGPHIVRIDPLYDPLRQRPGYRRVADEAPRR